jgi:cystathionine beta-lyase/cystathionine gamma-synthase
MTQKEMTYNPVASGGTYGVCSIFPTLQDIIDYEEKRRVPLQGYPRFIPHPYVVAIQQKHKKTGFEAFAVQTREAAQHVYSNYFSIDIKKDCHIESYDVKNNQYAVIHVNTQFAKQAKEEICNAGIVLNTRKANRILKSRPPPAFQYKLKKQLSSLEKGSTQTQTWCFNSGMAAIYCAVHSLLERNKGAVVIGSCYTDTYRIFNKLSEHNFFKTTLFSDSYQKEAFPQDTGLVFLEIPSNPLLKVEDLREIVKQAHTAGAIVMVDSTIATPWHFSPFEHETDVIVHSTSKSLSGKNNHMGGVLFINPGCAHLTEKIIYEPFLMDTEESEILIENLKDFQGRIIKMEENAVRIVEYLIRHNEVKKVYYPEGLIHGNGHVISFVLKDETLQHARVFYDNCTLEVKGPSMGFEKTMLMPYALMTRYFDTDDELASLGLSRYIMRLSVGTEDVDEIITHLGNGLNT